MAQTRKRITVGTAAQILGCTTQNVRLLARDGVISSVSVNSGSHTTVYYFEDEIIARRQACTEYLNYGEDTERKLQEAMSANAEAARLEREAMRYLKKAKGWQRRQQRLSGMTVLLVEHAGAYLTEREKNIIKDMINLHPMQEICDSYALSMQRVSDIATKAIRHILKAVDGLEELQALRETCTELRAQNEDMKKSLEYIHEHPETITEEKIVVMSDSDYALRNILLKDTDDFFHHWSQRFSVQGMHRAGIHTVADVIAHTKEELDALEDVSVCELMPSLKAVGLEPGMELKPFHVKTAKDRAREKALSRGDAQLSEYEKIIRHKLLMPVSDYGFSVRAFNCLRAADIETFGDLVQYRKFDIMKFRNLGKKSLREIEDMLEKSGLEFGMDVSRYGIVPKKKRN